MTISTTTIKNSFSGNGSTTEFTYTFKLSDEDEIQVIERSSTGVETVKTKDPKKLEYQKKAIEKLTKYCGKEPGKYKVPEELLTEGEITKEDYHTVSGLKPGEIMVLKNIIAFEMPYIQFRGDILIFCTTKIHSGTKTDFNYTPENEESVINENIRRLYDEPISIAYYDCRRRMRASDWGDGEIHWFPVREGRLTYSLHRFFCAHID